MAKTQFKSGDVMRVDSGSSYSPFHHPTAEYAKFKGFGHDKDVEDPVEVTNHDLLVAFLRAADAIHFELRRIRSGEPPQS